MKKDVNEYMHNIQKLKPQGLMELPDFIELMKVIEPEDSYNCYKGIRRSIFPKWRGWVYINEYKRKGVKIQDIDDPRLDELTRSHLSLMLMQLYN
jgi:hypothetical protein